MSNKLPDRVAIDANGFGWRYWNDEDFVSMIPTSDNNEMIPEPITWYVRDNDGPKLGLATTSHLLDELISRMEITAEGDFDELMNAAAFGTFCRMAKERLSPKILAYRTVGSE